MNFLSKGRKFDKFKKNIELIYADAILKLAAKLKINPIELRGAAQRKLEIAEAQYEENKTCTLSFYAKNSQSKKIG